VQVRLTKNKSGPISGATIQRGKWKDVSGKALHAVPPAGTAIRELSRTIEESEGHLPEVAASFVTWNEALAEPNSERL
jgi:hypothetical protein